MKKFYKKYYKLFVCLIKQNKLLSLILLIAIILRIGGVYPGYHPYHSDEGMSYSSAIEMMKSLSLDPFRYDYPSLIPIIHLIIYTFILTPIFIVIGFIFAPQILTSFNGPIHLWQQFVHVNQQTLVLFWGRFITALFGVGIVLLVYLLVNKLFKNKKIALISAFLTAVNYRQVLNSHLGLPDIYNAFFLLLALFVFSCLLQNPSRKNYLLAGVVTALSFSVKFQFFAFLSFIIVHILISWNHLKKPAILPLLKKLTSSNFLYSIILIPLIILLLNPYHLIHWDTFYSISSYVALKYGFGTNSFNVYALSYLYHIGIGPIISILIFPGIIFGFIKYTKQTLILLAPVVLCLYIFLYYSRGGFYTRNFITITPILIIFSALFLVVLWEYILGKLKLDSKKIFFNFLLVALLIFISFDQILDSTISTFYYTKPWSFKIARDWASINIPKNSVIVSHPWDHYPRDKNLQVVPFDPTTIYSLAEMREEGADYGFINLDWLSLSSYWWMNRSFPDSINFWNKPDKLMANTYSGVVGRELASYTVAPFVKPWQTPDMNIIIIKIPSEIKVDEKKLLRKYNFNTASELSGWFLINNNKIQVSNNIYIDKTRGHNYQGSLRIKGVLSNYPIVRAVSPPIPVKSNYAYIAEGWVSTDSLLPKKNRNGVIRIDFYRDNPGKIGLETVSMESKVSSRFYGTTSWTKQTIIGIAPEKARFLTVSIQLSTDGNLLYDDLMVYKSTGMLTDVRKNSPYIDYHLSDDILFPYSQGGM